MSSYCINTKQHQSGLFESNDGVNEKVNVIILSDEYKAAAMQSYDDLNEQTRSVNKTVRWNRG